MTELKAIHECLFCPQIFETAAAKDDHVLDHFAQETCLDCNRNLIRIGASLYTKHDNLTCIKQSMKIENNIRPPSVDSPMAQNFEECALSSTKCAIDFEECEDFLFTCDVPVKSEEQNPLDEYLNGLMGSANEPPDIEKNELNAQSPCRPTIEHQDQPSSCKFEPEMQIETEELETDDRDGESFTQKNSNDRTMRSMKIACEICGKKVSKSSLLKHKTLKHSPPDTFCKLCGRIFSAIEDRDAHRAECALKLKVRQSKKSNPDVRCDLCNRQFQSDALYRQHMQRIHKQRVTKFKCERCHVTFFKESWLEEHQCTGQPKKMKNTGPFPCEICQQSFVYKQSLKRHLEGKHTTKTMVKCLMCKKQFNNRIERDLHRVECISVRKAKGSGEIHCDLCTSKFHTNGTLQKHKRMIHDTSIEKFKCTKCTRIFIKEFSLQTHICYKNQKFPCDICNKQLTSAHSLRVHKVRFHSAPGTIYCDVCGKLFSQVDERDEHQIQCKLKIQMKFRRSVGRFECDICKRVYKTKQDVRRHLLAKHNPDVDKFKCKTCKAIFLQESSLQKHKCRGKQDNSLQREWIPCEACGKIIRRGGLNTHRIAFHSPAGTLFCRKCFKIFLTDDDLQAHRQTCSWKKKAKRQCDVCNRMLADSTALARHKISIHSLPGTVIFCKTCVKIFQTVDELNAHMLECTLKRKLKKMQKQNELTEDNME